MAVRREEARTTVDRYSGRVRVNHWVTAISLILLAISGAALFHPSLFFLSSFFGGGSNTRWLHPWIGVVLLFSMTVLVWSVVAPPPDGVHHILGLNVSNMTGKLAYTTALTFIAFLCGTAQLNGVCKSWVHFDEPALAEVPVDHGHGDHGHGDHGHGGHLAVHHDHH